MLLFANVDSNDLCCYLRMLTAMIVLLFATVDSNDLCCYLRLLTAMICVVICEC